MARRKKPLVDGAESGLDALRRAIQDGVQSSAPSYRERFLELARKMAEDLDLQETPTKS